MDLTALEDLLSQPSPAAVGALAALDGDLVVLGAGGKMGPSLCRMARRALDAAGNPARVVAVARFSDPAVRAGLEAHGVETVVCDLLDRAAVRALPEAAAVMFLAGTKFGTRTDPSMTWALNTIVPAVAAERYAGVPTVVFSSGNIYPFVPVDSGGAREDTPPGPLGEYAWSVLGRERIYQHHALTRGTPVVLYRLNYAAELRYGVPVDIARKVLAGEPIDLSMGHFNVIWQGDANAIALACLDRVGTPAAVLNVTGGETVSVRALAEDFGARFDRPPVLVGEEAETALLSDARVALGAYGPLRVGLPQLVDWIADWLSAGGPGFDKPTHFEVRDGAF